ncbi:hypothetical protein GCM10023188_41450 [Pontibacter saemangeumensis]|uniref:Uncharacterized protein n=1 Tax=Pontibacter saemangeumensis TaxID=1084525 RepID=A0ABP8M0Q5_9BACT
MESFVDLDTLTGKQVINAFALHDLQQGGLRQVVFRLEDLYLVVAVEAASDELVISVQPELDVAALELRFSRTPISNQRKHISYIWRMTNQRGYEDGFQLEFDDVEGTNVQLIAESAQLKLFIFRKYR